MKIDVTWTITAIIAVSSFLSPIAVAIINNLHQAQMRKMELNYNRQIKELDLKQQAITRQTGIYYFDKKTAFSDVLKYAGRFASQKYDLTSYNLLHSAIDVAMLFSSYETRSALNIFLDHVDHIYFGTGASEEERANYSDAVSFLASSLNLELESTKPVVDSESSES